MRYASIENLENLEHKIAKFFKKLETIRGALDIYFETDENKT